MKKRSIAKVTLCCGAALAIVATTKAPVVSSATLCGEKGLAGISITLDKYCATEEGTVADENQIPGGSVVSQSAVSQSAVSQSAVDESTQFDNIGISIANNYVNIRKKASEESKIIGKLYKGAAATVLGTDGQWVKIESGSCTGYVNQDFLAMGLRAEELADEYGKKVATVTATTLKVREKADTEASCLTMVPNGETYEVVKETDEWVKIKVEDEEIKGFVSKEYVDVDVKFEKAISIKEEKEQLRREAEAARAAEEAARAAEEAARAEEESSNSTTNNSSTSSNSGTSNSSTTTSSSSSSKSSSTSKKPSSSSSSSNRGSSGSSDSGTVKGSGTGSEVASYALQFVGNPYVWGGSSLTGGADCSGFVMAVYSHFGVSLPHSSSSQSSYGTSVSLSNAQPGDLVFYGNSGINHVGIYIGGGRIVHAKGRKYGITTDAVGYSSKRIVCVKRILK